MQAYCKNHPVAMLPDSKQTASGSVDIYGFKLETETRQYFLRCTFAPDDSRFILYAYADKPVASLEQNRSGLVSGKDVGDNTGHVSVLQAIEKDKKAPKPPRQPAGTTKQKNNRDPI